MKHNTYHKSFFFALSLLLGLFQNSTAQLSQPQISFEVEGHCANDTVFFVSKSTGLVYNTSVQDSITLVVWNYGDGQIDTIFNLPDTFLVPNTTHVYTTEGIFYPSLHVVNQNQLDSVYTRRIVISPNFTPTPSVPYFQDFEAGTGGWTQEPTTISTNNGIVADSLWEWGIASGNQINTTATNNHLWATDLDASYAPGDAGWVYSPCFDLTSLDRPMLSLDIYTDASHAVDGAVIEYYNIITKTWETLGTANKGINWYQQGNIAANPGHQNSPSTGWTGSRPFKQNARYRLNDQFSLLPAYTSAQFRIAFAATLNSDSSHDGFAFDNFSIKNNTKNVLIEHFSGAGYPGIDQIENDLYRTIQNQTYSSFNGVQYLQYHSNFYSSDPLYNFNPVDVNARILDYAITDANQMRINGMNSTVASSDFPCNRASLDQALLEDPKFDLKLQGFPPVLIQNNTLSANIVLEALENLPLDQYSVHVVITEDSLLTTSNHTTISVMRDMLPNYAGYTYSQAWTIGQTDTLPISWPFNPSTHPNPSKLNLIAFIQNVNTKEIYQVTKSNYYWATNNDSLCLDSTLASNSAKPYTVWGQVVLDDNQNCLKDISETGISNLLLAFDNGTDTTYSSTYSNGNYYQHLDAGTYTISVLPPSPYWSVCPDTQQVTFDSSTLSFTQEINWTLRDSIACPYLEVALGSTPLRATNGGAYYFVSYCNKGTVAAYNAYVEVTIDSNLIVLGSNLPIANQSGRVFTFNLDSILVGECGDFWINVLVDTATALVGQTHCTEAHIYPDSLCLPNIWNGAMLNTSVTCPNSDSVFFNIMNTGNSMIAPRSYYVVEDNIMMHTDTFTLGGNQGTTIAIAADSGKTYRIIVEQEINYPLHLGDPYATSFVEGCKPYANGSFNRGYGTQFSNGHSAPTIAIDCAENVSSFDPNDKSAQPKGYDVSHFIYQNTILDYKIRFQNTGTDTAFQVLLIDTLSNFLDPSSIQMGASSHPYTWELTGQNVLKINFYPIYLPDSSTNEPASQGFVQFRIQQKANNPLGTIIYNQAGIYFDYNSAILTNTTFHTIGEDFILLDVSVDKIYNSLIDVSVYPNPFETQTTFEVTGRTYGRLDLLIYDATGRLVAQEQSKHPSQIQLSRNGLVQGIYFYQLLGNNERINTGKIIVR